MLHFHGGSGEIRTHGPRKGPAVFKTAAINRALPRFHVWCHFLGDRNLNVADGLYSGSAGTGGALGR